MTALHQRHFTEADRTIYAAIGNSLAMAGTTGIRLDKGQSHAQKFSNRCAAAVVSQHGNRLTRAQMQDLLRKA